MGLCRDQWTTYHGDMSRTQDLFTKISQTCQSVRDIKERRKQLAFHKTSNTFKCTTSYSNPPDHNSPHSSTGDGGARDDNAKKSSSSTSSSPGGTHNPDNPAHRGPTSPAPDPAPTSRSPSPDGCPHSPPSADEEGSSPASEDAGKDPWECTAAARRATASCSCHSIQRLTSEDLKKGSRGDSSSESMSPKTPSESHSRRSGRDSGEREEDTTRGTGDTGGKGSLTQWVHCKFVVSFEAIHPVITQQV